MIRHTKKISIILSISLFISFLIPKQIFAQAKDEYENRGLRTFDPSQALKEGGSNINDSSFWEIEYNKSEQGWVKAFDAAKSLYNLCVNGRNAAKIIKMPFDTDCEGYYAKDISLLEKEREKSRAFYKEQIFKAHVLKKYSELSNNYAQLSFDAFLDGDMWHGALYGARAALGGVGSFLKTMLSGATFGLSSYVLGPNDWGEYRSSAMSFYKDNIDRDKSQLGGIGSYVNLIGDEVGLGIFGAATENNVGIAGGLIAGGVGGSALESIWAARNASLGASEVIGSLDEINATINEMRTDGKITSEALGNGIAATYRESEGRIILGQGANEVQQGSYLIHEAAHAMGANEYQALNSQLQHYRGLSFAEKIKDPTTGLMSIMDRIGILHPIQEPTYKIMELMGKGQNYWFSPPVWK